MELVFHSVKKIVVGPNPAVAAVESCFDTFTGRVDEWVDCSGVILKLNSVQLQLKLPAGTEIGKINLIHYR